MGKNIFKSVLGRYFLISILLITLIPLSINSLLTYNNSKNIIYDNISRALKESSKLRANSIIDFFYFRIVYK